jgi:hypothetical protein
MSASGIPIAVMNSVKRLQRQRMGCEVRMRTVAEQSACVGVCGVLTNTLTETCIITMGTERPLIE